MKLRATLIFLAAALILMGCATKTSDYLEHKPFLIYQVEVKESPQLQEKATKAFLSALSRYKWQVRNLNKEEHTIIADACRHGNNCVEIMATIMPDGSVSIIRTPGQVLTVNEGAMLRQWVNNLQRQYNKNMRYVW